MSAKREKYLIVIALQTVAVICALNNLSLNPVTNNNPKPYILRITKIICPGYPTTYAVLHQCRIQLKRNSVPVVVLRATTIKSIENGFFHIKLYYRFSGNYRPLLIDIEIDVCKFFKSIHQNDDIFSTFVHKHLEDHIPWKGPCPIEAAELDITNFTMTEDIMPNELPAGDYKVEGRLRDDKNVTAMRVHLYFVVRSKGLVDMSMG